MKFCTVLSMKVGWRKMKFYLFFLLVLNGQKNYLFYLGPVSAMIFYSVKRQLTQVNINLFEFSSVA